MNELRADCRTREKHDGRKRAIDIDCFGVRAQLPTIDIEFVYSIEKGFLENRKADSGRCEM